MINYRLDVETDILDAIANQTTRTPALMQRAVKRQEMRFKRRLLGRLREEPGRPRYPLRWKSERQRKFVMAKLRREGNLPYQRTHRQSRSWFVESDITRKGATIEVGNTNPASRFIQGADQQPFHIDTGWNDAQVITVQEFERFEDVLIDTWFVIADPLAGI